MYNWSKICLFLLTIFILSNLSSVESTRNDSESARVQPEHRIQKRIVGGWFSMNFYDTVFGLILNSIQTCTGTFIALNAILTAAHCCVNVNSNNILIFNIHHGIVNVTVLKYHINPDYKSEPISNTDIVIIQLTKSIEGIIPAKLNYSGVDCGETVWMYGYGRTKFNQTGGAVSLKELPANVVECSWYDRNLLHYSFEPVKNKFGNMILTHGKNGSTCNGDSGGPMFSQNGTLVGVISGTSESCSTNDLNYAVRISSHEHFIQSALHSTPICLNSASSKSTLYLILFIMITFYCIFLNLDI